jgi:dipeptidyl aminopeptidase/acylaminoacyl peptidase
MPQVSSYGSWKSPITAELYASTFIGLGDPLADGRDVYWNELRPKEAGRNVIVKGVPDGGITDITPSGFNARTRVHEYGGAAYIVNKGTVYFSNFKDQRLYRQTTSSEPQPITPEADLRYADAVIDDHRNGLICVREDHTTSALQAVNTIVSIDLAEGGPGRVLVTGNDFYSTPRVSPDKSHLAWLTWNHPNMPWDETELWTANMNPDGSLGQKEMVAGGAAESIFQPEWSPGGILYFVSDKTGWWNLYKWQNRGIVPLFKMEAEFGQPQWGFRTNTYAFESEDRILCTYIVKGTSYLARLYTATRRLENIPQPYTNIRNPVVGPGFALFMAGSPTHPISLVKIDLATLEMRVLRRTREETIEPGYISVPKTIEFPTENGLKAYAFYYPPKNKDYAASAHEKPPLLVMSHGGPTGSAGTTLVYGIQFWTSRGIAVVDVNYGGSTGYGREYRDRLKGNWGVMDVDDCLNAARHLLAMGQVDGERLAITGGSAGGYTTLCALTFRSLFKAGASYFGISDLEALAKDTQQSHKFESRYSDQLVGPYPERRDLYFERSPINFTDRVSCPMILFQGLEDMVVPPSQSEKFFEAVRAKGLPVAYLPFDGEQHGFRKAENLKRSIEAELYFYSKIFGFEPGDAIEPVRIENLESYKKGPPVVEAVPPS